MKIFSLLVAILFSTPLLAEEVQVLYWDDLVPQEAQEILRTLKPRAINHDGSAAYQEDRIEYSSLNEELEGKKIKLPGFIVPIETVNNLVTQFFIVPYFGACIHVPPPPANQLIIASHESGIAIENITDPYWVEGMLTVGLNMSDQITAGYQLNLSHLSEYDGY